jgi:beta-mannosidase
MTSTPTSPTCLFGTLILGDLLEQREMTTLRTQTLADNWEWRQRPKGTSELDALAGSDGWTRTCVPTEVFRDLLEAGKIEDPHVDSNEQKVQWVGEVDWVYRTRFVLDKNLAEKEKAVLAFDGLDTYANVYLNGKLILKSQVSSPLKTRVDQ